MKIQWEEPVQFAQACARSQGKLLTRQYRVMIGLGTAVLVVLLTQGFEWFMFWLHKKDLGVPLYFYVIAPPIAGLTVYFLPAMASSVPATIVVNDEGVYRLKPLGTIIQTERWPWEEITSLAVRDETVDGHRHRVLAVHTQSEPAEVLLGLGSASVDELEVAVKQMGKELLVQAVPTL